MYNCNNSLQIHLIMRPRFVLLGDSITERGFQFHTRGWGLQLASWYGVKADILNRGHSGYNTRMAMELLESRPEPWYQTSLINSQSPAARLVVIFWGANDAATLGDQGIPLDEYETRLRSIIQRVRECGEKDDSIPKTDVVLVTPPPVNNEHWLQERRDKFRATNRGCTEEQVQEVSLDRTHEITKDYCEIVRKVASTEEIPCVDLYTSMQSSDTPFGEYLSDGLHLSPAGNDFLFQSIRSLIKKELPSLRPNAIEKDFLEWRDALAESNRLRKNQE